MNKNLKILGAGLALALALTACGHEHTPTDVTVDLENHTFTCSDCGKVISAAHKFDEERYCAGCGFDIFDEGDGRYNVMGRDEYGATSSDTYYDADGNIESQAIYDTEYDENGNEISCKTYFDGVLVNEVRYELIDTELEFAHYIAEQIEYEDGCKIVSIYADYMMNPESVTTYDNAGNLISQTTYEYTKDEDGNIRYCASYVDGVIATEYEDFIDAQGNFLRKYDKTYENGELTEAYTYEYEFNAEGVRLAELEFYNDVLNRECRYALNEDGWEYLVSETYYDEDGNVTEEYHYDENGEEIE